MEDGLHIAINAKDFKAAVAHAETLNANVTARYSRPFRPLQLTYESDGIKCEFTLMTRGDDNDEDGEAASSSRPAPAQVLSARQTPVPRADKQTPQARERRVRPIVGTSNPAPTAEPEERRRPTPIDLDNSLFVPADDDRQWDEPGEETEDMLGWDATGEVCTPLPQTNDPY